MDDLCENVNLEPKNMFVPICITQSLCVAIILITVLIIKLFFDSSYLKLQKWCHKNFLEHTTITAFDEEDREI